MDCSPGLCGRHLEKEQVPNQVAVVYPPLLPGCRRRHISARVSAMVQPALSQTQHTGEDRIDGDSLSDRYGDFKINLETSRRASATPGTLALGNGRDLFPGSHPLRAHLNLTGSPGLSCQSARPNPAAH